MYCSLLHTCSGLVSCYRWRMNKFSKMKILWWTYNHFLFFAYWTGVAFGYGWISDTKFQTFLDKIGYGYAKILRIWIRSQKINIRSPLAGTVHFKGTFRAWWQLLEWAWRSVVLVLSCFLEETCCATFWWHVTGVFDICNAPHHNRFVSKVAGFYVLGLGI